MRTLGPMRSPLQALPLVAAALVGAAPLLAQDYPCLGGGPARDGSTDVIGPLAPTALWARTSEPSIIAWAPHVHDGRVFTVRETSFPAAGGAAGDEVIAYDLETGALLWRATLPYGGDPSVEFIAWIAGADGGRVYAARSQNQRPTTLRALDAATGVQVWESAAVTEAFAYDGVVFTSDGDLVVGDGSKVVRIDGATGSTVWETARFCPVSGSCGVALFDGGVYFDQPAPGGNSVGKLDLATGAVLYESPVLPGFTAQNSPFVGPDGTVYFARSQNNAAVDFLYAFDDTGAALVQRWSVPVRWTTNHQHAVAPDGSVYTINPAGELVRLDPATGVETANGGVLPDFGAVNLSPVMLVDGAGTVYVSNGWASSPATNGRLWAFDGDLTTRHFELVLDRQNQGGPALAGAGVLVMCDRSGVTALRGPQVGAAYCGVATPNSTGAPATTTARGSALAADRDLVLRVDGLPAQTFGLLVTSRTQGLVPGAGGSLGTLCLGGVLGRFNDLVSASGPLGAFEVRIDPGLLPEGAALVAAVGGETWNFQCWYRDVVGGAAVSNFSSPVAVGFL